MFTFLVRVIIFKKKIYKVWKNVSAKWSEREMLVSDLSNFPKHVLNVMQVTEESWIFVHGMNGRWQNLGWI